MEAHYRRAPLRTLMMGGSNLGHHTKSMLESFPELYDGGIAGYGQWRDSHAALLGYLRDSMPRFDPSYNPDGGDLTDDELRRWDPGRSPPPVRRELRVLDLTGTLTRPLIVMHGTADAIVSPEMLGGVRRERHR